MKRLLLSCVAALATLISTQAQTAFAESGLWDNWYVGANIGFNSKLTHNPFFSHLNPHLTLRAGKDIIPIVGVMAEFTTFFSDKQFPAEITDGDFTYSHTAIKAFNFDILGNLNLHNLFKGYPGYQRPFEARFIAGIGLNHVCGIHSSPKNDFIAKFGFDFVFSFDKYVRVKGFEAYIEPALNYNLTRYNSGIAFNPNCAAWQLAIGVNYHLDRLRKPAKKVMTQASYTPSPEPVPSVTTTIAPRSEQKRKAIARVEIPKQQPIIYKPSKVVVAKAEPITYKHAKTKSGKDLAFKVESEKPVTIMVEPTKVETAKVETSKVEPVNVESAKVEQPFKVEPAKVEPVKEESEKTLAFKVESEKPVTIMVEPEKVEPVKVEPTKIEQPIKVEPEKVEPVKVEPAKAEPERIVTFKVEPTKTEPAKAEPVQTEPVQTEPVKAEPIKTEPKKIINIKVETTKAASGKAEPAKTELANVEPAKAAPAKAEPAKAAPAKTEPAKAAPAKADTKKAASSKKQKAAQTPAKQTKQSAIPEDNSALPAIRFNAGNNIIPDEQYDAVTKVATYMKNHPRAHIVIKGQSDHSNAVKNALVRRFGINATRFSTASGTQADVVTFSEK